MQKKKKKQYHPSLILTCTFNFCFSSYQAWNIEGKTLYRYSAILSANSVQNAQNANPGQQQAPINDDLIPDYMNILGMIFSMCALMLRLKWAAWVAIYCSCISFANTKLNDDTKQIMSSFMLSISAVVMSYLQNPAPMTLPGTS